MKSGRRAVVAMQFQTNKTRQGEGVVKRLVVMVIKNPTRILLIYVKISLRKRKLQKMRK